MLLHAQRDLCIPVDRFQTDMTQQTTDDTDLDAGLKQVNRRNVSEHVRRDPPRWPRSRLLPIKIADQAPDALVDTKARHGLAVRRCENAGLRSRGAALGPQLLQGLSCLATAHTR